MNTISIIVSILIPSVVVGYIVRDLFSKQKVESPVLTYDKKIDEILNDSGDNHGDRKSQKEIIENTDYLLNTYKDYFCL